MSDEEILQLDFYDLVGIDAVWLTDENKIEVYNQLMNRTDDTR